MDRDLDETAATLRARRPYLDADEQERVWRTVAGRIGPRKGARRLATLLVVLGVGLTGTSVAVAGSGQLSESSAGGNSAAGAQYNPPNCNSPNPPPSCPDDDDDDGNQNEGEEDQAPGPNGPDDPSAGSGGVIPSGTADAGSVSSLPFTGLPLVPLGILGALLALSGILLGRRIPSDG